jgi:hypothetical protein
MQEVTLGEITIPAYPQRIGRLSRRLPAAIVARLGDTDGLDGENVADWLGDGVYDVLCVLLPNLEKRMTREEFLGEDTSPTVPEVRNALRVAIEVNEIGDLPGMLGKLLGPTGVGYLRATALEGMTKAAATSSPSSPSASGDLGSMTSTTSDPISTVTEDSPSRESVA